MALKVGQAISQLQNKFGFTKVEGSGRNPHERLAFRVNGKKVATTGFSRGFRKNTDIDDTLLRIIAREVRVRTLGEIKGMITCTVSRDRYLEILQEQKYIEE